MADRPEKFTSLWPGNSPPCWTCRHKHGGSPTCEAFPERIPEEILTGENQHREEYPGDNGIQYEPIP